MENIWKIEKEVDDPKFVFLIKLIILFYLIRLI